MAPLCHCRFVTTARESSRLLFLSLYPGSAPLRVQTTFGIRLEHPANFIAHLAEHPKFFLLAAGGVRRAGSWNGRWCRFT